MSVLMGNTIDSNGPYSRVGQSAQRLETGTNAAAPKAAPKAQAAATGHVTFSDTVSMMHRMQERIDAEPSIDPMKVAAAKEAIADGSYRIDYNRIAAGLIDFENELS